MYISFIVAHVFFESSETSSLESNQGAYITVVLTGNISHNLSVDMVDDNGMSFNSSYNISLDIILSVYDHY